MGRRSGRGLDPVVALEVSLHGTAGRLASDDTPVVDAIATLRDLAAAHLLVLASNGTDHDVLVGEADRARRSAGGAAYSLR